MIFHSTAFGVALGPTQFYVQWKVGALLLEEKQPGHEAHLHLALRLRMCGAPLPLHGVVLNRHSDFTFTFMHSITVLAC